MNSDSEIKTNKIRMVVSTLVSSHKKIKHITLALRIFLKREIADFSRFHLFLAVFTGFRGFGAEKSR